MVDAMRRHQQAREQADRALSELIPMSQGQRLLRLRNSNRYHTPEICAALLDYGYDLRFDEPATLHEFAEAGLVVADRLAAAGCDPLLAADLRGRARAHLANAESIQRNFESAEQLFMEAEAQLRAGSGDVLEKAFCLKLRASLYLKREEFAAARILLQRHIALLERVDQSQDLGEAYLNLGAAWALDGDDHQALQCYDRALELLDETTDKRILLELRFNRLTSMADLGRNQEALNGLVELRRELELANGPATFLATVAMMEGEISQDLGQLGRAEDCFEEARQTFAAIGMPADAAITTLRLAILYLRQGRLEETKRLAEQFVPVLQARKLDREALAALLVFREAALRQALSVRLVLDTIGVLEQCGAR